MTSTCSKTLRRAHWSVALGLAFLVGCQSPGPKETKVHAEEHWNGMRAGVKLQLGRQQAERGLFESALSEASAALALEPNRADAYVLAVEAHLELGQLASAERLLEAARRAGVASPDLTYLTGVVHEQRGDVAAASRFFREAREANVHNVDYVLAEAESLVELGRARDALALLETNLHSLDDDASVAAAAGRIAALLGDDEQALSSYRLAFSRQPASPALARSFGLMLARLGHCVEAIAVLRELFASEAEPPPPSVCRALAACHLATDEPALAIAVLTEHLARQPDDAAGQLIFAQAAIATRDDLGAARSLYLAETNGAPQAKVLFLRGVLNWRQGNLAAAADSVEQALSIDPSDADASCLLGDIYAALGEADSAAEAFARALHLSPSNVWAQARLNELSDRMPQSPATP